MRTPALLGAGLAVALAIAAPARAQDPTCAVTAGQDTLPDVRLYARVRIAELRFATAPRAHVQAHGCVPSDTVRVLERRNLPSPVEPGVTYRDVEVAVEITTRLAVICGPLLHTLLERPDTAAAQRTAAANLRRICTRTQKPDPAVPPNPAVPPRLP